MARPLYENQESILDEMSFAEKIASKLSVNLIKLPIAYNLDFAMMRSDLPQVMYPKTPETAKSIVSSLRGKEVVSFAELKRRGVPSDRYSTLVLSLNKVEAGLTKSRLFGKPFFIFVRYSDKDVYLKYKDEYSFPIHIGGRYDRGDYQDIEPVVHIPKDMFTELED